MILAGLFCDGMGFMKTIYLIYAANNKIVPHFPESSLALASVLMAVGHKVSIIDSELMPKSTWKFENPLFFGITIFSNESILNAIQLAKIIRKQYPDIKIIWGGPHVHMVPEETAKHHLVDAACYGEGETTIVSIAKQLEQDRWNPDELKGIIYRDKNGCIRKNPVHPPIELDRLPLLPYEMLDRKWYPISNHKIYYQSSRGCPFFCRFCSYTAMRGWQEKSSDHVVHEIEYVHKQLGIKEVYFSDGNFFVKIKRVEEICHALIKKKLGIKWTAFCRADTVDRMDDDTLALLSKAGCRQLDIGGESGSDRILKYLEKGTNRRMLVRSVKRLTKFKIRPEMSFMLGVPLEDKNDRMLTLDLIDELINISDNISINGIFQYQPYPNTSLCQEIMETWRLPLPKSLEEWGMRPVSYPRKEYFPWLSQNEYSEMMTIHSIFSYFFLRNKMKDSKEAAGMKKSVLYRLLHLIVAIIGSPLDYLAAYRWKHRFFQYLLEWNLYRFAKVKILKMI